MIAFTLENYHQFLLQNIPSKYREDINWGIVQKSIQSEFEFVQKTLINDDYAQKFRQFCLIPNTTLEDYKSKFIVYNDINVLCSLRFLKRNVEKPYIFVEYYSSSTADFFLYFEEIKKRILDEFKIFNVKKIRISLRNEDLAYFKHYRPTPDLLMYSAKISDIKNHTFDIPGFKLERIQSLSEEDYTCYTKEYTSFNSENPLLSSAFAEPLDVLNKYCASDYGFKAYIDGEWAGFALFVDVAEYFFYGYLVWDKIVFKKYRGMQLSAAIQNNAFNQFIPHLEGYVYGNIQYENTGSRKTAEKSGRENLLTSYFFE